MAKKKQKRRARRQKSNLIPLVAIAAGVYLLMSNRGKVPTLDTNLPTLPSAQPGVLSNSIGVRVDRSRYMPTYY
jgi:hypothetical protein